MVGTAHATKLRPGCCHPCAPNEANLARVSAAGAGFPRPVRSARRPAKCQTKPISPFSGLKMRIERRNKAKSGGATSCPYHRSRGRPESEARIPVGVVGMVDMVHPTMRVAMVLGESHRTIVKACGLGAATQARQTKPICRFAYVAPGSGRRPPRNPGRRQSRGAAQRWYRPEVAGPSSRPSALALPPVDAKRTQFGPAVDRPRRGGRTREIRKPKIEIRKIADGLRMSLNVINKANFSVFSAETEGADEKQSQFGVGVARPGRSMPENPKPEARYPKGRWWPENEAQRDKRTQFCRFQWGWWARPTLPGQP